MKKKNFQKKILVMACVDGVWVVCDEKVSGKNIFVCVKSFLRNPMRPRSYPSSASRIEGPKWPVFRRPRQGPKMARNRRPEWVIY
jgi:hypothetical protein